jgi:diacylglycerol kinase family enzyme
MTIYSGAHVKIKKYVDMWSGKDILVKTDVKCYFQADGEVMENVNEMHVAKCENRLFSAFNKAQIKRLFANNL